MIIIIFSFTLFLSAEEILVSIKNPDNQILKWVKDQNIEITHSQKNELLDIIINEKQLVYLQNKQYQFDILSTEEQRLRDIAGYRNYEDVTTELQLIASTYPTITQLTSLGNSTCHDYYLEGDSDYSDFQFEVWCLKLSDNPNENEDEPNIFYAAEIHAREPISLEVDMHILNYLVSNYGVIDSVTAWIDSTQIWFIPLMNPDGHKLVTEGWHTYHRKNMLDNNANGVPDYSIADGVDLNRNFGYVWGDNGTSNDPNSSLYHGPYEWSEKETTFARNLLRSHKFFAGITYHSYGQDVLYPLGHLPGACSYDHEIMGDLAVNMAATIPRISGGYYTPMQAVDFGYTCQGTMGDWGYAEQRIFSYTIELATTFIPQESQVEQICENNLQAALIMLDRVNHSTITGLITDENEEPLIVEVYVTEIDSVSGMTSVEPFRSGNSFGRYYRLLLPGEYAFTFHKENYADIIKSNVTISEDSNTELDICLKPEFINSQDINIFVESDFINLQCENEADYNYEIYSSSNPYTNFELNITGEFVNDSQWKEVISDNQKFFMIKRISAE
ncbi:MAG: M14 family zinc carboxypeptidase [Candidatus Tenebribacter burtonii]|nr:M14 family zinc carboxypeptidase [Candidatus Tenebribacter burtonii]